MPQFQSSDLYAFPPPPSGPQFLILFDHFAISPPPLPPFPHHPLAAGLHFTIKQLPNQPTNQPTEAKKLCTGRDTPFLIGWPFVVSRCTHLLCPTMSTYRQIMRPRLILIHSMRFLWVGLVLKFYLCWFSSRVVVVFPGGLISISRNCSYSS